LAKEKEVVGIYISGHPLDDYKFEMKYFCNAKLEHLKKLEYFVGKPLTVGGIVNNVQHKVAKNGKGWGIFTLEGYDESYEFKIFGEDYLKFRHFFLQNNFVYIKLMVKEGWVNQDTGKKADPRIVFTEVKQLQDVLASFSKKLTLILNITDLQTDFIHHLNRVFQENKGDHQVSFEIMELEKIKRMVAVAPVNIDADEDFIEEMEDDDNSEISISKTPEVTEVEEISVVTKLSMPSRRLKINICNELLVELEKMQINFKLN
ncbi:MAG: DNA polymerase III subunit alpha, partial [Flavobacterium sp.]